MCRVLCLVVFLSSLTTASLAGVNRGGTLIVHAQPPTGSTLCIDDPSSGACSAGDPCVQLDACENARTTTSGGTTILWSVLAAFPGGSSPHLSGITFGIEYTAGVALLASGHCASFQVADPTWPASGSGTGLSWSTAQTTQITVVYWFIGYNDPTEGPGLFRVTTHPTQGADFGDDSVPSVLDPIEGFGALGFDQPGVLACPTFAAPTGACCFESGDCSVRSADSCTHDQGIYRGDDTSCDPNPCPQPIVLGACCASNQSCTQKTRADCEAGGGQYLGDGEPCTPNPCIYRYGACCSELGICSFVTHTQCDAAEGYYQGDFTSCDPDPCAPHFGACCLFPDQCVVRYFEWCATPGVYLGDGVECTAGVCSQRVGACCFDYGHCSLSTEELCETYDGLFQGPGTSCNSCPPQGACCSATGSCYVAWEPDCESDGGLFQGGNVPCSPNPCPLPLGACCLESQECVITLASGCAGLWLGALSECEPNPCVGPTGACCLPDGSCGAFNEAVCDLAGVYEGDGTSCEPNPCPAPVGPCCFLDGHCTQRTMADCEADGGEYLGHNRYCQPNPCPQPPPEIGACCLDGGDCIPLLVTGCNALHGEFQGVGTSCIPNPCTERPGACCLDNQECIETLAADCDGRWLGSSTTCEPYPCGMPVPVKRESWGQIKGRYR